VVPRFVNKLAANLGALNKLWSEPKWMAHAELKVAFANGSTADPRMHARTHPPNQQLAAHCYLPGFPLLQFTSAEIDALRADTLATVKGTIAAQQLQPPPSRRRCIG